MKQEPISGIVIRPSMKLVRAGYTAIFCVLFVCVLYYTNWLMPRVSAWVLLVPSLLLLWPLKYHLRNRFTQMLVAGDKLRYETGVLGRTKRVIQLSKVQDVRVVQTVTQRLLRLGDLSIETAGETSLLTIRNIDNPDAVTEEILRAAHPGADEPSTRKASS